MTAEVVVAGVGMIPFGRYPTASYTDLAGPALLAAIEDAGIPFEAPQAYYCGAVFGGSLVGQRVLRDLGLTGPAVSNLENACSSGSTAFREAYLAISSGDIDVAVVFGVDQLTQFGGGALPLDLSDHEVRAGMVMPALYAMRAQRYLHEHDVKPAALAQVTVKSREFAANNVYAQLRRPTDIDTVLASRPIADPLTLFQCCPTGDGAAAAVLTSSRFAEQRDVHPIRVLASVLTSGRYETGFRDLVSAEITQRAAQQAYDIADLGPEDIDVTELHDAFTIAELLYYEAFGFCAPGEAVDLLESGATSLGGSNPVNPSGGLLSRGHPVGATGVAQIVEIVWQLRGECGPRQVPDAQVGMTHVTGGGLSGLDHGACSIHILAH